MHSSSRLLVAMTIVSLLALPLAHAQQSATSRGIGVVTALQGQATVTRTALPEPAPLRFKEDVFFRDVITTKERSTVRLLLGGKGVLTIREQSQVTLAEETNSGGRQSVMTLLSGKVGAAIAKSLMNPGESVEIRTPNAVAAVRGTVIIAEYIPAKQTAKARQPILLASAAPAALLAQAGSGGGQSNFFVLSGSITITVQGQPPVSLGAMQAVSITATPSGTQVGAVQTVTPAQAAQAAQGLQVAKPHTGEAEGGRAGQIQAQIATTVANAILEASGTGPAIIAPAGTAGTNGSQDQNTTPPPPTPPIVPAGTQNTLPEGPALTVDGAGVVFTDTPMASATGGTANTVNPITVAGPGLSVSESTFSTLMSGASPDATGLPLAISNSPLLTVSGDSVTHSGDLVRIQNGGLVWVASDGSRPMIGIRGSNFTNDNGYLLSLNGSYAGSPGPLVGVLSGSVLGSGGLLKAVGSFYWGGSLLSLDGATLTGSGVAVDASNSSVFVNGPVFALHNGSRIDWKSTTGSPIIRLSNSSLLASGGYGQDDGSAGTGATIVGPMLEADHSSVFFSKTVQLFGNGLGNGNFSVDAQPGAFQVRLTDSSYNDATDDNVLRFSDGTSTYHGLLLSASNSVIASTTALLRVGPGKTTTTTETNALIQLSNNASVVTSDDLIRVEGTLNLAGPLLDASTATIVTGMPFSNVVAGPVTTTTGATGSLLNVLGGTLTASQGGSLLRVTGIGSIASTSGPSLTGLSPGGPVVNVDGGTINLTGSGNLLTLDAALLMASMPVMQMLNGANVTVNGNSADLATGAIHLLNGSTATIGTASVPSPGFQLDNSFLTVRNGPLLSVTGGTQMTINGDFLSLYNGARVTLQNGPLIYVSGQSPTGAPSTLTFTGALINFGAVNGNNRVIINNSITPNQFPLVYSGGIPVNVPVSATNGGSINLPMNAINNLPGNIFSVTGSVIQATNGGQVNPVR